jgi:PPOX class probable F420-dependent enzyme
VIFDSGSDADRHALERLETEMVAWLATVTPDGQPQTFPIWFLWRDGELLIYSDRRAKRNANIAANPKVAFHLHATKEGGDVVVIEGTARIDPDAPGPQADPAYLAKYDAWIKGFMEDAAAFAEIYNVGIRITPTRGRAFGA